MLVTPAKAGAQRKNKNWVPAFAGTTMLVFATPGAAQDKKPPYWASIASGQAMTRTGPAKNYPGIWLYQRHDLPVRVIKKYENWRLIQDPDGTQGWMLVTLLSDRRTASRSSSPPGGSGRRYRVIPFGSSTSTPLRGPLAVMPPPPWRKR
jgi:hypothetical protein